MRPDNALHCACLAMQIIPSEYAPEVVSVVTTIAQSLTDGLATESVRPLTDQAPRPQWLPTSWRRCMSDAAVASLIDALDQADT